GDVSPNTARPTCAITVRGAGRGGRQSAALGQMCTWLITANPVTPPNIDTAITPSIATVVAASLLFGFRNPATPLLIPSTPVRPVQPEENARSSSNTSSRPLYWRGDGIR